MTFELDRAMFKRLVWLNIVASISVVVAIVPQYLVGRWADFNLAFDALVEERFGPLPLAGTVEIVALLLMAAAVTWSLASTIGLLWFKRWARVGFWLSPIICVVLLAIYDGFRPTFRSSLDDGLAAAANAVFGAVVFLSYAKGLGAEWFKASEPALKD